MQHDAAGEYDSLKKCCRRSVPARLCVTMLLVNAFQQANREHPLFDHYTHALAAECADRVEWLLLKNTHSSCKLLLPSVTPTAYELVQRCAS